MDGGCSLKGKGGVRIPQTVHSVLKFKEKGGLQMVCYLIAAGFGWAAITQQGSMVELESYCMSAHFMAAEFGDNLCVFKRGGRYKLAAMYV